MGSNAGRGGSLENQTAMALSWLACGSTRDARARALLDRFPFACLSRAHREAAAIFLARARPFARRGLLDLRGRRESVAVQLPFVLPDVTYDRIRPRDLEKPTPANLYLVAEWVSLPSAGATVPVAHWLPTS